MRILCTLALLVVFMSYPAARCDDKKADDAIDGTWIPTSAEFAGNPFPDEVRKAMRLDIKAGEFKATVGKVVDRGTIKLDPSAKPKKMETKGTDGPNKGRTFLAIYERDGDTLRVCYDTDGKKHPVEFKTREGTQLFYIVYKREGP